MYENVYSFFSFAVLHSFHMADEDVVGRALTFIKTDKYQYVKFFSDVILIFFDLASCFLSKWHVNCF